MIYITKWIEKVGLFFESSKENDVCIYADSPFTLTKYLSDNYDITKHQAVCGIRFENSDYILFIENISDIPNKNIFDPSNGKYLIKYDLNLKEDTKAGVRLDGK
jgi:hypothetical protein